MTSQNFIILIFYILYYDDINDVNNYDFNDGNDFDIDHDYIVFYGNNHDNNNDHAYTDNHAYDYFIIIMNTFIIIIPVTTLSK